MIFSRGSSVHFKPQYDINNSKIQSKFGAEEARDQAVHTNTIISMEYPPIHQEEIVIRERKKQDNWRQGEENVPPKSKPVWKSIEEEVKKEDREGV
jgi:hypothetical protein